MQKDTRPKADPDRLPPMEFMTYDRSKNYSLSEANVLLRSLNLRIDSERDKLWVAKQCNAEDDFTRQILDIIKRIEKERSDLRAYIAWIESSSIPEAQTGLSGVQAADTPKPDRVNRPSHYGMTPKDKEIEDLKKAVYYINRKIKNLEK